MRAAAGLAALLALLALLLPLGDGGRVARAAVVPIDWSAAVTTDPGITALTDLGTCICDLTANVCDFDCCCDTNCTTAQIALFSQCDKQRVTNSSLTTCAQLATVNTGNLGAVSVSRLVTGAMCVVVVNNPATGTYYSVPTDVTDSATFATRFALDAYTTSITRWSSSTAPTTYKVGTLLRAKSTLQSGYFTVPSAGLDGYCSDGNFVGFWEQRTQTFNCTRFVSSLSTSCTTAYSASEYLSDYQLLITPASSTGLTVSVSDVAFADLATGNEWSLGTTTVPSPSFSGTTCSNALYKIEYTVSHDGLGTLTGVTARVVITSITSASSAALTQFFGLTFARSGTISVEIPRSGNPGYLSGLPVLAGYSITSGSLTAIQRNTGTYATIVSTGVGGACNNSRRQDVLFNRDFSGGCVYPVTLTDVTTNCVTLRSTTLNLLRGAKNFTHVAQYGNASVDNIFDWIQVLETVPTLSSAAATGLTCADVPVGVSFRFLVAKTGQSDNPQFAITGALISYQTASVTFQCFAGRCTATTTAVTMPLLLQNSVQFVDTTSADLTLGIPATPPFLPSLPNDIFYPFVITSGAAPSAWAGVLGAAGSVLGALLVALAAGLVL